jgi:D-3-phosphoglycerate dehydrogenase
MKIVVAEKISPSAIETLRREPGWQVVTADQVGSNLAAQLADADALIVRSAVDVNAALLEHAAKLRVIGRAGVGVDNVDLDAATRKGIAVMNTPGANAVAVAEHTLGLMVGLARHLSRADAGTRSGKWEKKSLQGTELRGKRLGIVGLGRVGMEVARRARAFGMDVIAHDPFISATVAEQMGARLTTMDEVITTSDYLTLHVGLTPQTATMINPGTLARMKRGVRIVNCARGELIDELALAAAIESGQVGGAALDVFCEEPPKHSPLLALENVIATPHIAGSTHEAQDAVGVQIAEQVREYLTRGVIQNAVNVPSVSYEEYVEMQPYITLAERLGSFLAQITSGSLQEIAIRYGGRIANWRTELLRNAAIQGVLNQMLSEKANLVNAAAVAQSRGILVTEQDPTDAAFGGAVDVLTLMLKASDATHVARGTVLHGNSPRLLFLDGIDIESRLERDLVYLRNRDVPGVVGRVGTVLAEAKINIANFSLGRDEQGTREAVGVVRVDSPVPEPVMTELRQIEAVIIAKAIRL